MSKLTDWFPAGVKPVRVGVYERDYGRQFDEGDDPAYQFWDGSQWLYGTSTPETTMKAVAKSDFSGVCQYEHAWRGLAEPPGEQS